MLQCGLINLAIVDIFVNYFLNKSFLGLKKNHKTKSLKSHNIFFYPKQYTVNSYLSACSKNQLFHIIRFSGKSKVAK